MAPSLKQLFITKKKKTACRTDIEDTCDSLLFLQLLVYVCVCVNALPLVVYESDFKHKPKRPLFSKERRKKKKKKNMR